MTAHFLPPGASRQKPQRLPAVFPKVSGAAIKGVPGKKGLPYFGILPEAVIDPLRFATRMFEEHGPVHRFWACGNWNVQLVGPEANEFVLSDQAKNFSSEGGWKPVFGRYFDGGLLLRDGEDHLWHRKVLASAFKQDQLQSYLQVFSRNIARTVSGWSGRTADVYELSQTLTFRNGYEGFLGRDALDATRNDLLSFRYLMRSATSVVTIPFPGNSEWRAKWAKAHVSKLIRPMFEDSIAEDRTDLLAVLLRMHEAGLLDEEEILAHLTFTIAASFDALSSATCSTLYYLAAHPEWQARLREELCDAVPDAASIGLAELQRCELSDWCIKEALRLNAAAPVLWRRSVGAFSFQGHQFPAGTVTGVNPMLTHLLPDIWPDPRKFDPTRFEASQVRARHRYAYVPFGAGVHACLGGNFASLQVRALLRALLERHEIRLSGGKAPNWYHWPNCRPRRALRLQLARL
jgi:cytochrome P450